MPTIRPYNAEKSPQKRPLDAEEKGIFHRCFALPEAAPLECRPLLKREAIQSLIRHNAPRMPMPQLLT
jgi:hypothetical protein